MTKSIRHKSIPTTTAPDLTRAAELAARRFTLEHQIGQLKAESTTLRGQLLTIAETHGTVDEHGHQRVLLDAPVTVGDVTFTGYVRRRSVTQSFNENAARELVEARGLTDRVLRTKITTYVDQDELWACQQEGLLTAAEIDSTIDRSYTHSLWGTT